MYKNWSRFEVESLQKAADKLRKVEGVDIIIAVGHSGYNRDLEIASEVGEEITSKVCEDLRNKPGDSKQSFSRVPGLQ